MSRGRWLGLLLAVLAVGAALWVLGDASRSRSRAGSVRSTGGASAGGEGASTVGRGRRGVERREVTVAGVGTVRGQVVDEDGLAVVEGQLVLWCLRPDGEVARIRDGVLSLDEQGAFEGPACRGEVCPELRHPSRIPAREWILQRGEEGQLATRMLPRLWGRVVDPEGEPVAGAQVVVTMPADEDPAGALPVTTSRSSTDADGLFSLALIDRPPCDPCQRARGACHEDEPLPVVDRVLVTARAAGWAPGVLEVDVEEAADPDAPVELLLRSAEAAITGTLVDAAGEALPRAIVLARSELRSHEQHRAEAGDGVFAFDALADGPYGLRAIQDGTELLREGGVEPGESVTFRLPHAQRDVVVRLRDEDGRPVVGAEVRGGPFETQRSDEDGRVRAERAVPGTYILRIRPVGARARAHDLVVPPGPDAGPPPEIALVLPRAAIGDDR